MHSPRSRSLDARTTSQRALHLQKRAGDLVANRGVALVVVADAYTHAAMVCGAGGFGGGCGGCSAA